MRMKMKKSFWKGLCAGAGFVLGMSGLFLANSVAMAAGVKDANGYYIGDVTAPWGRLSVAGATEVNNVNYVDKQKIEVQIFASDDMCTDSEIMYAISTTAFSDTEKITTWESYSTGKTVEITLPKANGANAIYLVLKDKNGNTSMIYNSSLAQTVTYDLNATDATIGTGIATSRVYGAPFVVTSQTPKRAGYYFLGWGLNAGDTTPSYRQGDVIPADVQIGTDTGATLYAIWSTDVGVLPKLSSVVSLGDYVNYPVYYDNVSSNNSTSYIGKRKGWRVLSKDVDIDGNPSPGTVNLVSAGVPLTYYHYNNAETSIKNLAINFLSTPFTASTNNTFRTTGFNPLQTLTEVFNNKYTATYSADTSVSYSSTYNAGTEVTYSGTKGNGTLKVRAMTKEDVDKVYDPTGATETTQGTSLTNAKYQDLLAIPANSNYCYYWLASAYSSNTLRYVYYYGNVNYYGSNTFGVRPVVSLKSEVVAEGTDMIGAWNIHLAEN